MRIKIMSVKQKPGVLEYFRENSEARDGVMKANAALCEVAWRTRSDRINR